MTGFAGAVQPFATDKRAFAAMSKRIRAQGVDSQRSLVTRGIALSSSSLPIPGDPFDSGQPLSLDGEKWIVADARLDDRERLVEELRSEGEVASPNSSETELILRAYRVWNRACVSRLWGDFAFAIWDERRRTLFGARDRFGCKPFYFAQKNGEFLFSNTLRAIQAHPMISERLEEQAIGDFLLFDFNRHLELTYFADIQRLPPAHYLSWSDGRLQTGSYWRLPIDEELHYANPQEYIEHFRHLLRLAVEDRIRTSRVGILMSGGMDSTAIAATAAEIRDEKPLSIRAFSTVYDQIIPDKERLFASSAARHLKIPISFLRADDYGFHQPSGHPDDQSPEPQNTPFYPVWMDGLRMAAQFSPVALHGNGGDEILDQPGSQFLSLLRSGQLSSAASEFLRFVATHRWLPRFGMLRAVRLKLSRSSPWAASMPCWLAPAFEDRLELRSRWQNQTSSSAEEHPRHPVGYRLLQDAIWPATFEAFHPGATGCNLDVRTPLLDVRLVRFGLSLPVRPWLEDKGLLRTAMRRQLPRKVRRRPKTPLPISPEEAYLKTRGRLPTSIHPEVRRFVDQRSLEAKLRSKQVDPLVDLRPLALSLYLQNLDGLGLRTDMEDIRAA